MSLHRRVHAICMVALLFSGALNSAAAAPVYFGNIGGDSSAFDAATSGSVAVDGFEDLGPGLIDYGQFLARSGYNISAWSNDGGIAIRSSDSFNVIDGNISMIQYNDTDPLTFSFDAPINAFGINFRDLDMGFGGQFTVAIDNGVPMTLLDASAGSNLDYFFGVIDYGGSFSSITFNRTAGDGYNYDLLKSGNVVPIPAAVWLFSSGLGLLVWRSGSRH